MTGKDNVKVKSEKENCRGRRKGKLKTRKTTSRKEKEEYTLLVLYILRNFATGLPRTENCCAQYINPSVLKSRFSCYQNLATLKISGF